MAGVCLDRDVIVPLQAQAGRHRNRGRHRCQHHRRSGGMAPSGSQVVLGNGMGSDHLSLPPDLRGGGMHGDRHIGVGGHQTFAVPIGSEVGCDRANFAVSLSGAYPDLGAAAASLVSRRRVAIPDRIARLFRLLPLRDLVDSAVVEAIPSGSGGIFDERFHGSR